MVSRSLACPGAPRLAQLTLPQSPTPFPHCVAGFELSLHAKAANVLQQPHAELLPRSRERQRGHRWSHKHVRPTFRKEGARAEIVCVCVPCAFAVRSYVQTRFLATEDSSTLTPLLRLFVFNNMHSPKKNSGRGMSRRRVGAATQADLVLL